jgi:hypothetical protein
LGQFFGGRGYALKTLPNFQEFDDESLKGRLLSSSYTPAPGHSKHEPMLAELQKIFRDHQVDGVIRFEYETKIYYGRIE